MARRYILAIDGGGLRGIIPAVALAKLEAGQSGAAVRDVFSFVAGTSTGAIIAAAVAAGIPAQQVLQLYLERANLIFPRRPWNNLKRVVTGSMYSSEKLRALLAQELGSGQTLRLDDLRIDILITAKGMKDGKTWYFVKSKPGHNSGRTGHLRLIDCAVASAAAPTYFPPYTLREDPAERPPGSEPIGALVDGGVSIAGNPVYRACVEAFGFTGEYSPDETIVVSFGTGRFANRERPTWIWPWVEWTMGELLRSPGEQQTELVNERYPRTRFYRIDTELKRDIPLDDGAGARELLEYGELLAKQIDWPAILAGTDTRFLVTPGKTQWEQYRVAVK